MSSASSDVNVYLLVSYLCVGVVVCVQAVSLRLRLYLARLLCSGGGTGSAAGCDGSPLTAWSPCGAQNRGHHLCMCMTHMTGLCDTIFTHTSQMFTYTEVSICHLS